LLQRNKKTCALRVYPYNSSHAALQHLFQSSRIEGTASSFFTFFGDLKMMTVEQVLATQKANVETLLGLTAKAFEGVEKIVELNMSASKAALAETGESAKAMLSVKDAQELLALQSSLMQPLAEKTAAYSRHLYEIATGTTTEFTKAIESQAAEAQQSFTGMLESAAKNAPAGSEAAVAVMKSAVAAASNALESVQKAVKQATDVAEANFTAMANTATASAKPAGKKR